ncbi:MAG: hypothetical protein SFU56_11715 [Capsulimonadales bacterium]|nr:hypothetical protein [Capsulimonadales bacterium]
MKQPVLGCLLVAPLLVGLAGCASPDGGPGGSATAAGKKPPSVEDQIKRIENNPNMPPEAKQAALANMRASYKMRGKEAPSALQSSSVR